MIDSDTFCELDITHLDRKARKTQRVSFKNAIKLMMVLPGKNAKDGRANFVRGLLQFIACDAQLKAVIDRNAESNDLLNILAREALRIETSDAAPSDNQNGRLISNTVAAAPTSEKNLDVLILPPSLASFALFSRSQAGGHLNTTGITHLPRNAPSLCPNHPLLAFPRPARAWKEQVFSPGSGSPSRRRNAGTSDASTARWDVSHP